MKNPTKSSYRGFTLAEVIITLVVIGIVAALVMPQINITYQRATLYAQFMKTYGTLTKAVQISSIANSEIATWNMNPNDPDFIISNYIKPYVNIIKEKEISPITLMDLNLNTLGALNNYVASKNGGGTKQYFLADGSSLLVYEIKNEGAIIMADVNGEKTPNIIGRDIHLFLLQKSDGQVVPSAKAGAGNGNCGGVPDSGVLPGEGCAARMIAEGKMAY